MEMLATSCVTSGVPMLFIVVLSVETTSYTLRKTYVSGNPICCGSPGSWYAVMSACTIKVKFLSASRISSGRNYKLRNTRNPTDVPA